MRRENPRRRGLSSGLVDRQAGSPDAQVQPPFAIAHTRPPKAAVDAAARAMFPLVHRRSKRPRNAEALMVAGDSEPAASNALLSGTLTEAVMALDNNDSRAAPLTAIC